MRKLTTIILILCLTTLVSGQFFAPNQKPCLGLQVNWGHPLARGLVGCWLINEGSGNKVFDSSGNGNNGIAAGTTSEISWQSGPDGSVVDFVGNAIAYFDVGITFGATQPFTIIICAERDGTDIEGIVCGNPDGTNDYIWLGYSTTGVYWEGANDGWDTGNIGLVPVAWNVYAFTSDGKGANSTRRVYLNGILVATSAANKIGSFILKGIGNGYSNAIYAFDGRVKYASAYNRILSASEIALRYREPFCMFDQGIPVSQMYDYGAPPGVVVTPYYYRGAIFIPIFGLWYYLRRQRCAA